MVVVTFGNSFLALKMNSKFYGFALVEMSYPERIARQFSTPDICQYFFYNGKKIGSAGVSFLNEYVIGCTSFDKMFDIAYSLDLVVSLSCFVA